MAIRECEKMLMHSKMQAQIEAQSGTQVKALLFDKVPTEIPAEYSDYSNIFSVKNAVEHPGNTGIYEYAIEIKENKQSLFRPIYSLGPMELEILKTYIKTNLANGFIWPFKSPAGTPILFDKKPNRSFCLYIDYRNLNNKIIKNQYLLLLIGELLDWVDWVKRFTQLNLTNDCHRMRICGGDE